MMNLVLSNYTHITGAPDPFLRDITARLSLENPAYLDAVKMGRWTGKIPQYLHYYTWKGGALVVPRGFTGQLINMAKQAGLPYQIFDRRRSLPGMDLTFTGTLKPFQQEAVNSVLARDNGVLQAPTGSGKTVMALGVIAERKQPVLVVVHTKELLNQWKERIETFLDIPKEDVGVIGSGKARIGDKVTVGIINSIYPISHQIKDRFGFILVDECHRCPSRTFTEAVTAFDSKYMLGLSATPYRRDGLTKLIGWHLGPQVKVEQAALTEKDIILDVEVVIRETCFTPGVDPAEEYSRMLSELCEDPERNILIADDVVKEATNGGGTCLVLSDRRTHCEALGAMLRDKNIEAGVLTGATPNKEREAIVDHLNAGDIKVLVATGQLIGEGFDCKGLSTLFLTTPVKFSGRLLQYLGRIVRPAPGKDKAKVYDYIDPVGVLQASAKARQHVYGRTF